MAFDFKKAFGADYPFILDNLFSKQSHIAVTGASGWLGRATLELFSALYGDEFNLRVSAYGSREQQIVLADARTVSVRPLVEITHRHTQHTLYLFHFAFLTKDKVGGYTDDEYIRLNRAIQGLVTQVLEQSQVKAVLLSSSGAVYDYLNDSNRDESANLYGRLKYEDELLFQEICSKSDIKLLIPRIFNLSGPYINKLSAYALSSIIANVVARENVLIRANKPVFRSYIYILDLLLICIRLMFSERFENIVCFDTVGDETVEVGELAEKVCKLLNAADLTVERPNMINGEPDSYLGNEQPIKDIIKGFEFPVTGLDRQILETAEYIRNLNTCSG
ncbi:NAD(P)-dependent oxidoreductase [Methylomonas sp. EFPC1]|uniref:NAD(P)-dependent oxidoreductase n=1 Tax=Methylomonas defluvii TaxID=3045149 RepID=A0ABU4UFZ5_9GAMM|nr:MULTISPECIES: NAD(P)-dependent oxidoreductase [unclassified Methylomonas]MDX8128393.1 NAD(P)-dependent oxidoreductase [Methylomonas sp. OY6]QSA99902.1 NAD(P)-dependent oxidoreductase [Methylomonas sp. EFPC1]